MARRLREVTEGQWFRKIGPGGGTWQVVSMKRDARGALHAQIRRLDERNTFKTLSTFALLDAAQFEPIEAPEPSADQTRR